MSTIRWGQAKREVTALWPLISRKLAEASIRQIWIELHGAGEITVSQSNFYVQVSYLQQPQPTGKRVTGRDLVAQAASSPPVTISDKREPTVTAPPASEDALNTSFVHNKSPTGEEW